ncbi:hypothetical protein GLOIN_2v1868166 [Rhizophagus irregularis DAOM 181602=DAOM 197198]|nr:hypothetical protein GLOIN_2v1868166 [Rhizophagus irregularis DAOM 181602=DAOM 197198]
MSIDGTRITLWCFVQGSSSIFKVKIGTNNDIDDLKKAIKSKKPNDTAGKMKEVLLQILFLASKNEIFKLLTKTPINEQTVADPPSKRLKLDDEELNKFWRSLKNASHKNILN